MNKIDLIKEEFPKVFRDRWKELGNEDEGRVQHDVYGGRPTKCRASMWTLAKILGCQNWLELGSWKYFSSNMIALSLDENYGSEYPGEIISIDIARGGYDGSARGYIEPASKRIKAHYWMPQHTRYDEWKYKDKSIVYPEFKNLTNEQIFEQNSIFLETLKPDGGFQAILIDDDHCLEGIKFSWKQTQVVASSECVFIIDDLKDFRHADVKHFWDELDLYKYDFEDINQSQHEYVISLGVCQK